MTQSHKLASPLILVAVFVLASAAFSQSTPPLNKPIEKPQADRMSESGRIQEKIDERRNSKNSPDSDQNQLNPTNLNPSKDDPRPNQNPPGVKLNTPPGVDQ